MWTGAYLCGRVWTGKKKNSYVSQSPVRRTAQSALQSALHVMLLSYVTHLHETSRMSAEFVFRYGPKCMGGVILPILVLLHL